MDLKELGDAMAQALVLRSGLDALDDKLAAADAQIKANQMEIVRLKSLESVTTRAIEDKKVVEAEREKQQVELTKRLEILGEVGVKLPLAQKFGTARTSL